MTDIAAILREHHSRQGMVGADHKCVKCNVWFDDAAAFAAHQAEKVWEALKADGEEELGIYSPLRRYVITTDWEGA